jgi:hypothetical protein
MGCLVRCDRARSERLQRGKQGNSGRRLDGEHDDVEYPRLERHRDISGNERHDWHGVRVRVRNRRLDGREHGHERHGDEQFGPEQHRHYLEHRYQRQWQHEHE